MNKSETIAALSAALSKAQAEIKPASMDRVNPFLKSKYADLGSVIEAARGPLAKNGLAFSQLVSGDGSRICVETILTHSSGEWISGEISLPVGDEKGRSLAQGAGSIITYLRRYSLSAILGVYADEDTDGQPTQQRQQAAAQQPVVQQTPGNGSKPYHIDLEDAMAMTTPKGARLDSLTVEQLDVVISATKHETMKIAAEVVRDYKLATMPVAEAVAA